MVKPAGCQAIILGHVFLAAWVSETGKKWYHLIFCQKKRLYLFHHSLSLIVLFFCHHLKETNVYQTFHYRCLQCVMEWFFFALAIIIRWLPPPTVTLFCQVQVLERPNSLWLSTHVGKKDRKFIFNKSCWSVSTLLYFFFQRFKWPT